MPASHVTKPSRKGAPAFTIVELLVSVAVLSLLVALLGTVFNQVSRAWITGEGNIERQRGARALADFIGSELQGALLPIDKIPKTDSSKGDLHLLINPPESQVPSKFRFADAIFWQAPLATETSFGDVAEIGYFVRWDDQTNPGSPRPNLCRFFVNPSKEKLDADGKTILQEDGRPMVEVNQSFKIYDDDSSEWLTESLINQIAPATKQYGYRGLFAENILGFWVKAYGMDGEKLPRIYDSRTGYPSNNPRYYLPGRVQISFAQLDTNHVPRLDVVANQIMDITQNGSIEDAGAFVERLRDEGQVNGALQSIIPGVRIYTTEVQLENAR